MYLYVFSLLDPMYTYSNSRNCSSAWYMYLQIPKTQLFYMHVPVLYQEDTIVAWYMPTDTATHLNTLDVSGASA